MHIDPSYQRAHFFFSKHNPESIYRSQIAICDSMYTRVAFTSEKMIGSGITGVDIAIMEESHIFGDL